MSKEGYEGANEGGEEARIRKLYEQIIEEGREEITLSREEFGALIELEECVDSRIVSPPVRTETGIAHPTESEHAFIDFADGRRYHVVFRN